MALSWTVSVNNNQIEAALIDWMVAEHPATATDPETIQNLLKEWTKDRIEEAIRPRLRSQLEQNSRATIENQLRVIRTRLT
jgi:hypothetical protein